MDKAAAAGGKPEERMKHLSEAEKVLVDEIGNIPLLYYSFHNIVSPKLKGFEDNVMDVHPSRFISKELRPRTAPLPPMRRAGAGGLGDAMLSYVIRRLLTAIPTLFVIVTIAFFLMRVAPGGPFNQERGPQPEVKANLERRLPPRRAALAAISPLSRASAARQFRAELQSSRLHRRRAVSGGLPISIQLGASALILALIVGGALGIVAALNQNKAGDYTVIALATAGSTIPTFVIAPLYPARLRA